MTAYPMRIGFPMFGTIFMALLLGRGPTSLGMIPDGIHQTRIEYRYPSRIAQNNALGTHVIKRYVYTPSGEIIVHQKTGYDGRDGDQDVDSTDKGTPGTDCAGTLSGACRILDLDFDGDYDSTDATKFDSLPQGLARHPGRIATGVHQP